MKIETQQTHEEVVVMGATPLDEIAKQHEQAFRVVAGEDPCSSSILELAPLIDYGEIPMARKEVPMYNDESKNEENSNSDEALDQHPYKQNEIDANDPAASEEDGGNRSSWNYCISSRGQVDVSEIQALIREGYNDVLPPPLVAPDSTTDTETNKTKNGQTTATASTIKNQKRRVVPKPEDVKSKTNFWDETNAAVYNVAITRPSHDAWGIQKIVLIFCDDFIRRVYELPWYSQYFHRLMEPIYQVLQVAPHQIVRLLFASLPPGVTIPLHHDTGIWVKHTHRVHVPIIVQDPAKILFTCGPTPTSLQRISCHPGHVFEMNNQAKHAVSNCSQDHRVHIILDYVNEEHAHQYNLSLERILLQPGERLLQTRRSIDRICDQGTRPTPSFLILGAQKAGTTSLYEYMMQHPLIIRAKRRETHCLDWRWKSTNVSVDDHRKHCQSFYHTKELHYYPSCLTGDSTPSYLLDSVRVIPRIQKVFPWPALQFLVMLRDPVQRAASHYAMVTSPDGTPEQLLARGSEWRSKTMQQVVQDEMAKLQACGVIPYWNVAHGTFDRAIFEQFVDSPQEDAAWTKYIRENTPLHTGSHNLIARGLYALQLRPWFKAFASDRFMVLSLEQDLSHDALPQTLKQVWQHLKIPDCDVADTKPRNTRDYAEMDADLKQYLQRFYQPHNERLYKLLRRGSDKDDTDYSKWANPWPYSESGPAA